MGKLISTNAKRFKVLWQSLVALMLSWENYGFDLKQSPTPSIQASLLGSSPGAVLRLTPVLLPAQLTCTILSSSPGPAPPRPLPPPALVWVSSASNCNFLVWTSANLLHLPNSTEHFMKKSKPGNSFLCYILLLLSPPTYSCPRPPTPKTHSLPYSHTHTHTSRLKLDRREKNKK